MVPKLKKYVFIENVIITEDSVNPLLLNALFLYYMKTSEKFSEGIKREHWVDMTISENRAFHPNFVETEIFSTGFVSTHGWNSRLEVAEKIVLLFEKG